MLRRSTKSSVSEPAPAAAPEDERKNAYLRTVQGLKDVYNKAIKPVEEQYKFDQFFSPLLEDSDLDAKPIVLLIGPYSVGKTSFIRYLIERDFPGIRVGPEPTTDRFVCVMHGEHDQIIPGNALCVAADKPFRALNKFGTTFLNRFEGAVCNSRILENMILVDTPGVLSGEKQRVDRQYDFTAVIEWFASRADRILLLFDAHKLDISDELKRSIAALKGHDDKVRVVLNKADSVSPKQLMRVYGALMWSLGKVVNSPEVLRVYIGSFWGQPLNKDHDNSDLFEAEATELIADLKSLPHNSAVRKINELIKRARMVKVHAYIMAHIKSQMPSLWGKGTKKKIMLENLQEEFSKIAAKHRLPPGDFPNPERFKAILEGQNFSKLAKFNEKAMQRLDEALSTVIPGLLQKLSDDTNRASQKVSVATDGEALDNPFAQGAEGSPANSPMSGRGHWAISYAEKTAANNTFYSTKLTNGRLSGAEARGVLEQSGLTNDDLFKIWSLADLDKTNALDADEFAVAMHLINQRKAGQELPAILPPDLIPPSKRSAFN